MTVVGKEFSVFENLVVNDELFNFFGVFKETQNSRILDVQQTTTHIKPNKLEYEGFLYFYDFMLSPTSTHYHEVSSSILDIVASTGGLIYSFSILMVLFLYPFKYNITQVFLLKDFLPIQYENLSTWAMTLKCLLYDLSNSTRCKDSTHILGCLCHKKPI